MKIVCIHCGGQFSISAENLGGRGRCPHCSQPISLPKPQPKTAPPAHKPWAVSSWLESSASGVGSLLIHLTIFLIVALWEPGGTGGEGETTEVLIGQLPVEQLTTSAEEQLTSEALKADTPNEPLEQLVEVEPVPASTASASAASDLSAAFASPSGGELGAVDLGPVMIGGASLGGGGGDWNGLIQTLRRNGLEVVLAFDSTGSMGGEIEQVKRQIKRIGGVLLTLVPKARISLCTYRDLDDEYVAKGLPLTGNIQDVEYFLSGIKAGGGGDHPEAVEEGLAWSLQKNSFRPAARKVILVFGDAPPHTERLKRCLQLAGDFAKQQRGVVSTVTCRASAPLPEFYEIARAGGGEAYLTSDEREIMTQLMVLVFGSQHRAKVIEAFNLLDK